VAIARAGGRREVAAPSSSSLSSPTVDRGDLRDLTMGAAGDGQIWGDEPRRALTRSRGKISRTPNGLGALVLPHQKFI
jgi:hypothetical protein